MVGTQLAATPVLTPRIVALSKTVPGSSHLSSGKVCQDASCAYMDASDSWRLAVVSDGHGDPNCARSDRGSKLAVEVAAGCLREFADHLREQDASGRTLEEDLLVERRQASVIRRLTDAIISRWVAAVRADLQASPLTSEEIEQASERERERYLRGEHLEHVYGATLVCALWLPKMLVLVQQGDGTCLVLDREGAVSEPVPVDERCLANITTSLCDSDAATAIRHAVLTFDTHRVAACMLGSDGVENSFPDDAGLESYVKGLLVDLASDGDVARMERELEGSLPELSRAGSGDDMSLALMAHMGAMRSLVPTFKATIERQGIERTKADYEAKLISMQRKHELLRQRRDDAFEERDRLEQELADRRRRLDAARRKADESRRQIEERGDRLAHLERQVVLLRRKLGPVAPHTYVYYGNEPVRVVSDSELKLARKKDERNQAEAAYNAELVRYEKIAQSIKKHEENVAALELAIESLGDAAVRDFNEYDAQYQQIRDELNHCEVELAALDNEDGR